MTEEYKDTLGSLGSNWSVPEPADDQKSLEYRPACNCSREWDRYDGQYPSDVALTLGMPADTVRDIVSDLVKDGSLITKPGTNEPMAMAKSPTPTEVPPGSSAARRIAVQKKARSKRQRSPRVKGT